MPIYEYRCNNCKRKVSVFFRSFSDDKKATCEHCSSEDLTRVVSQVSVMKSWGESLNFPGAEALDGADENDPVQMKEWMTRMKQELGDEHPHLTESDLLDAGIDPHGEHGLPDVDGDSDDD